MSGVNTCSYCDALAVRSSLVSVGHKPADPKHYCGMQDTRRIVVVRACIAHAGRLGTPRS